MTDPNDGALEVPNKWIPSPRARAWLYGVATAVAAVLVAYGVTSPEQSGQWIMLVGAILGTAPNALALANTPK